MGNAFATYDESAESLRAKLLAIGVDVRVPTLYYMRYTELRISATTRGSRLDFIDGDITGFRNIVRDLDCVAVSCSIPKCTETSVDLLYSNVVSNQLQGLGDLANLASVDAAAHLDRVLELATPDYFQPNDSVQLLAIAVAAMHAHTSDLLWLQRLSHALFPLRRMYPDIRYIVRVCAKRSTGFHVSFQRPKCVIHAVLESIGEKHGDSMRIPMQARYVDVDTTDTESGCVVEYAGGDPEAFRQLAEKLVKIFKHGQAVLPAEPIVEDLRVSTWLTNRECPHLRRVRLRLCAVVGSVLSRNL